MPATREQLEKRWETSEGLFMAQEVCRLLARGVPGSSEPRLVTEAELQQLISSLPFREEVAPRLDLRGLHLDQESVDLYQASDLSGARLEYAGEIGAISATRMVGTIFDGCRATNSHFSADFTSASFVGAHLQGVRFFGSSLVRATFRQAKLALASLREINCQQASFDEADLRFVDAWHADLRGANLAGADLTEANLADTDLSSIQFNEQTRVQGADLYGARLDEPFRAFAEQAGGLLRKDQVRLFKEREKVILAAIIRVLKEDNESGHLDAAIACLEELAQHFAPDPEYSWSMKAEEALSPELMQEVMERYAQVSRALAYYL